MAQLRYQDRDILSREGESVLDALLRQRVDIPFSCRSGACHVCLQRCAKGKIPPVAQHGLRSELVEQGYFLACQCVPIEDMEIAPPSGLYTTTLLASKQMLSPNVCKLLIEPPSNFVYFAGQFINLRRADGLVRSYSLASIPGEDYFLEIHVQRKNAGLMSNWILDELKEGDELEIEGPSGECYYKEEAQGHPLLLIATGTGLSPIIGIVRDALFKQHLDEIHLYHGARASDRFYLRETLRKMEHQHANFHYHECLSGNAKPQNGEHRGRVHDVAFAQQKDLRGWHAYLAGLTEMVDNGAQLAAKHGVKPAAIHADAFTLRDLRDTPRETDKKKQVSLDGNAAEFGMPEDRPKYPPPDPELWAALREGEVLTAVLKDFYGRIYEDKLLSSFFVGVTKQRLVEKQYSFVRQIITGEKLYFGDRPRNTHHWMIVSDELFDYRANIMLSCLREHGLAEPMVQRFHAIEEYYRRDIVKAVPIARTKGGIEVPYEGFDEIVMDVGTLCDSCEREVSAGEKVIFHVRIGKIYCSDCSSQHSHEIPSVSE